MFERGKTFFNGKVIFERGPTGVIFVTHWRKFLRNGSKIYRVKSFPHFE